MKVKKKRAEDGSITKVPDSSVAIIAGVNDLSDEDIKGMASQGAGFQFMKLGQAVSGAVTDGSAKIGDFSVGQENRNLGTSIVVIPVVRSNRAQLWGKGARQGELIAESRTPGAPAWNRIEAGRGEVGYEFGFYHPEDKCFTIMGFGKYWARQIGEALALGLKYKYGTAVILESYVLPKSGKKPPLARFKLVECEKKYKLPESVTALRAAYLETVAAGMAEEVEVAAEGKAPEPRRPR